MWEQIGSNRRKSLFLSLIMALFLLALGGVLGEVFFFPGGGGLYGAAFAFLLWLLLLLMTYVAGDKIILSTSGAKPISHDELPQLFNVVEEMQIAGGLPKPPAIYVIDDSAPNAFTTGTDPRNATVAVTSGLLSKLNRDELQGVIAHETAHIVNRDVLFMTTLGIMLGTVVLLADAFWRIIFRTGGGRRSAGKGGYAQLILFLIAIVLVIIAPIATRLIYFAISRKREYLADACGAQLTRYPEGLASALEKIAAEPQGLKFVNRVTAPMFIANPYKPFQKILYGLEGTHPPIEERIRILHSMGGGASIADYQRAWLKMRPTADRMGLLFSKAAITKNANIPAITAAAATPATSEPVAAARKIGDVLWKKNRYSFIDCECGVRLKIPPDFHSKTVRCPKCRSRHDITERIFLSA